MAGSVQAQLPRSGARRNGLLAPLGAVGAGSGLGSNRLGFGAGSWSAFACAAATASGDAVGGSSSGPLRPQPGSASATAASRTTVHLDDNGLEMRFTAISPKRRHHTKIASPWRDPEIEEIAK